MKKLFFIVLLASCFCGNAIAENGIIADPVVNVVPGFHPGSISMYGVTSISELNPSQTSGSFVKIMARVAANGILDEIDISMYDVDTSNYGYCVISKTSPLYEFAKSAFEAASSSKYGMVITAAYSTSSIACSSFTANFDSIYWGRR